MRYGAILAAALAATPALAQQDGEQQQQAPQTPGFPSTQACQAVSERVQLALSRADQALQDDQADGVAQWTGAAADYAAVYGTYCDGDQGQQ